MLCFSQKILVGSSAFLVTKKKAMKPEGLRREASYMEASSSYQLLLYAN